jgi:hypothetical protein
MHLSETSTRLRLARGRCVLAGVGFSLAHLLHFGEVWAFYGSFGDALTDLQNAAYRGGLDEEKGMLHFIYHGLGRVYFYVVSPFPISVPLWYPPPEFYHPSGVFGFGPEYAFRFLGLTLGIWWPLVAVVLAGIDIRRRLRNLHPLGLIGVGVSCGWSMVMANHARIHGYLLYRHLSVCFVLGTSRKGGSQTDHQQCTQQGLG